MGTRGIPFGLVVCALASCRCGGAKHKPTPRPDGFFVRVSAEDLVPVPDDHGLLHRVVSLTPSPSDAHVVCTATPVAPRTFVTAAHCLAARAPLAVPDHGLVPIDDDSRACREPAACSQAPVSPPAGRELEFAENDLGTARLEPIAPPFRSPAMSSIEWKSTDSLPDLYMVSSKRGQVFRVCAAHIVAGVGEADGEIDLGDSGSPLVAVEATDGGPAPVVIGVVSWRAPSAGRWYFAPVRDPLPWPRSADDPEAEVERRTELRVVNPQCEGE